VKELSVLIAFKREEEREEGKGPIDRKRERRSAHLQGKKKGGNAEPKKGKEKGKNLIDPFKVKVEG